MAVKRVSKRAASILAAHPYHFEEEAGELLHEAVMRGKRKLARQLIAEGFNVLDRDVYRKRPLFYALNNEDFKMADILLEAMIVSHFVYHPEIITDARFPKDGGLGELVFHRDRPIFLKCWTRIVSNLPVRKRRNI